MSDNLKDGGAAFPSNDLHADPGISKLDWFAGQALAGMAAGDMWSENFQEVRTSGRDKMEWFNDVAKAAYQAAQAMLAERERLAGGAK